MSQIKTLLFLTAMIFGFSSAHAFDVTNALFTSTSNDGAPQAERYEKQIICAMKAAGAKSDQQLKRVGFVAEKLGTVFSQMSPELKATFIHHLLAQGSAETDNLRLLTEEPSKYASSRKKHKGRGLSQTTHQENYAKLAGCERVVQQKPHPARIDQEELAQAHPIKASDVVSNPDQAMNEHTDRGQLLNSLGSLCYFLENSKRHPKLAQAMEGTSPADVNTVGVALNRGPGAIGKGKKPLGAEKRQKAFKDMKACFSGDLEV